MACKTGKVRFRDRLACMIKLARRQASDKGECRCYRCEFCGGWHMTSQRKDA